MQNPKTNTCALTLTLLIAVCNATAQIPFDRSTARIGKAPNTTASADFNGDGVADIAGVNQADNTVSILLGKVAGTLRPRMDFITGAGPVAIITGDFNHDGIADLAVLNTTDNSVSILLGHGDGTFRARTDYSAAAGANSFVAADFNGDGILDLAIANSGANTISVLLGRGDGTFAARQDYATGPKPASLVTGHFGRDGHVDLAVVNETVNSVSILMGKGDGTFKPPASFHVMNPVSIRTAESNGSGTDDLFVRSLTCQERGCTRIGTAYASHGNGSFTASAIPFASVSSTLTGPVSTQAAFAATSCSQAPGVNICEPLNGSNTGTSARLFASANVSNFALLRVYENNRNVYETSSQNLDINLGLTPGSNHLVLVAYNGVTGSATTAATTVSSSGSGAQACTVATDRTINICFPSLPNGNFGALFQLQARARWDNNIITHMRVYIDNLAVFDEDTPVDGYINPVIQTTAGVHTIVIVAWSLQGEAIASPALTDTFFL